MRTKPSRDPAVDRTAVPEGFSRNVERQVVGVIAGVPLESRPESFIPDFTT